MQTVSNVLEQGRFSLLRVLGKARLVVDATAGNGKDTLFLAEHTPPEAHIYAFDIQKEAMQKTRAVTAAYAEKIHYLVCGHEFLGQIVPEEIDVAVFNLGYLPGADHGITTRTETTRRAAAAALTRLRVHGICLITVYPGHPEGSAEADMLAGYLSRLPVHEFTVGCYQLMNHKKTAPYVYLIERTGRPCSV